MMLKVTEEYFVWQIFKHKSSLSSFCYSLHLPEAKCSCVCFCVSVKLWSTNLDNSVASIEAKANVCCVKFSPTSRYHLAFGCAGKSRVGFMLFIKKVTVQGLTHACQSVQFISDVRSLSGGKKEMRICLSSEARAKKLAFLSLWCCYYCCTLTGCAHLTHFFLADQYISFVVTQILVVQTNFWKLHSQEFSHTQKQSFM